MTSVRLFQTVDGGNISVTDNLIDRDGGLESAAYLSLLGGNEGDDGRADNPLAWWGNLDETVEARRYRSETQFLLQSLPASSGNLRELADAAGRDLAWFVDVMAASEVRVSTSLEGLNRVNFAISIIINGIETNFNFTANWRADIDT